MDNPQSHSDRTLRLYGRLQRINVVAFYMIFVAVLGGMAIACLGLDSVGLITIGAGFSLLVALCLEQMVVFPFLRCPSCGDPFFLPRGRFGFLSQVNPHNRTCLNCGLEID